MAPQQNSNNPNKTRKGKDGDEGRPTENASNVVNDTENAPVIRRSTRNRSASVSSRATSVGGNVGGGGKKESKALEAIDEGNRGRKGKKAPSSKKAVPAAAPANRPPTPMPAGFGVTSPRPHSPVQPDRSYAHVVVSGPVNGSLITDYMSPSRPSSPSKPPPSAERVNAPTPPPAMAPEASDSHVTSTADQSNSSTTPSPTTAPTQAAASPLVGATFTDPRTGESFIGYSAGPVILNNDDMSDEEEIGRRLMEVDNTPPGTDDIAASTDTKGKGKEKQKGPAPLPAASAPVSSSQTEEASPLATSTPALSRRVEALRGNLSPGDRALLDMVIEDPQLILQALRNSRTSNAQEELHRRATRNERAMRENRDPNTAFHETPGGGSSREAQIPVRTPESKRRRTHDNNILPVPNSPERPRTVRPQAPTPQQSLESNQRPPSSRESPPPQHSPTRSPTPRPNQPPPRTVDGRPSSLPFQRLAEGQHYPEVHGLTEHHILQGINRAQTEEWREIEDANCLVQVLGAGDLPLDLQREDIRTIISGVTNAPPNSFRVSAPGRDRPTDRPNTFLLSGLPQNVIQTYLDEGAIVTDRLRGEERYAIRLINLDIPVTYFLGTVTGLSFDESESDFVVDALHHHFHRDQRIIDYIVEHHDDLDEDLSPREVVDDVLEGLSVVPLRVGVPGGNRTRVVFQVYWYSPFGNTADATGFLNLLRNVMIHHVQGGDGTFNVEPYRCGYCGGLDHPTGLCRFPNGNGWLGPTLEDYQARLNRNQRNRANNGDIRGNGGNSRGGNKRGRGGNRRF
ncbi:hypothetical protein V5O48_006510 [Marasmius crinis-equi]|uniref:Uncharacterized protein n=1 Tax=Marasmius crinis-equi TaxID=585013 RepID=A0ABR3FJB2_9AGAR